MLCAFEVQLIRVSRNMQIHAVLIKMQYEALFY